MNTPMLDAANRQDWDTLRSLAKKDNLDPKNGLLCWAIEHAPQCAPFLMQESVIDAYKSLPLRLAAQYGQLEVLQSLLPHSNPKEWNSYALGAAALNGHAACVQFLIPYSDPKADMNRALRWAATRGHLECVKLLIPVSDLDDVEWISAGLRSAAENNHTACVEALLPYADATEENSEALCSAISNDNQQMFDLLYPHSDPYAALQFFSSYNSPNLDMLTERIKAEEEKQQLQQHVSGGALSKPKKM